MKAKIRRRIAMARRALDFAVAHPLTDTGYTTVVNRLKTEVEQADKAAVLQEDGTVREHAATLHRLGLRQQVRSEHLVRLCKIAAMAALEHPEVAGRFPLPSLATPNRTFITKARALLAAATEQKELLTSYGLGDTFIEELTTALANYDVESVDSHGGRADHVGAVAEVTRLANACKADVTVLDTFMRRAYATDPQTLTAWRSAKNLVGPFTTKPAPEPAPAPEPVPASVPVPTPPGTAEGQKGS